MKHLSLQIRLKIHLDHHREKVIFVQSKITKNKEKKTSKNEFLFVYML